MTHTMRRLGLVAWSIAGLFISCTDAHADTELRIASYNIKYLDADKLPDQGDRADKLRDVIAGLEADVIALQEIDDRDALHTIFNPDDWWLIIDEGSGERQDLAFAVARGLDVQGISTGDQDADDDDFLFSDADNTFFPDRRDVLAVTIDLPNEQMSVTIMNVHQKSRFGGRASTDERREDAARLLVEKLEAEFDDVHYILLGDFNDTPDDRSMNILETGDPQALAGPEQIVGPFLANLCEPLWVTDHVTHGRKSNELTADDLHIILTDPGARQRNNDSRGTDDHVSGDIMFDQILVPMHTLSTYVPDSMRIYDGAEAAIGNNTTRASDHLPIYADFVFHGDGDDDGGTVTPPTGVVDVRIVALLPNPDGTDAGSESITIRNDGADAVRLDGWSFRDRADNTFVINGTPLLPAGEEITIVMTTASMPLNNGGDEIELMDPDGAVHSRVEYDSGDVDSGVEIDLR